MTKRKTHYFATMSRAHWLWSVAIAAAVYFVSLEAPNFTTSNFIFRAVFDVLPSVGPLLALVLLLPAPVSFIRRLNKKRRLDKQHSLFSIQQLGWFDFELLVSEAFRRQGYQVKENEGAGADGGIDLTLIKDNQVTLVQCKHWKSNRVGVNIVREMFGVLIDQNAKEMLIVTSGQFTKEAIEFANNKPMQLIDGDALLTLIGEVQTKPNAGTFPMCPKCQAPMMERTVRKGPNKGKRFLGCSKFPTCRHTEF